MAVAVIFGFQQPATPNNLTNASGSVGQVVGKPAPEFSAKTLDGSQVQLSDYKGTIVAISFWASWCEPCKQELPELQKAAEKYPSSQLTILAVNAGELESIARTFISPMNVSFTVILDPDQSIMTQYRVGALPITYWVDPNGVIQQEQLGPLDLALIDHYIALLKGKS